MRLITIILASLTGLVNPFVGSSNFGATNPGAVCPNGLMSVAPFNVSGSDRNTWDKDSRWWSTPYSSDNCFFTGFSHVNLSGVGCPDMGAVLVMPTTGSLTVDYKEYGSTYSAQQAEPGYYRVDLDNGVRAEATATLRSSIERFIFPKGESHIILNLGEALTNESGAWLKRVSETEVEGMRLCGGFGYAEQTTIPQYFVLRVSKAPKAGGFFKKQPQMTAEAAWDSDAGKYRIYKPSYQKEIAGDDLGYYFTYETEADEEILVQVGVSFVSTANARENLDAEQSGWGFDRIKVLATKQWEEALGRIKVEGGTKEQQQIFYTALYHALIHPNILNDVNGEYPKMGGGGIGKVEAGHNRYTVFSLWDTYRNVHQLLTLVYPEKQIDMVRSMVDMYKESDWMPKWELYGQETQIMEGDPAIPVIVDTYLKGLRDFDVEAAYEAFVKSANTPGAENPLRPDIDPYIANGYIPLGFYAADFSGDNSVSHALEYYVADAALARFAEALGHDGSVYRQRSLGYKNYYSTESGCLRPRNKDGSFLTPFNPLQGVNFEAVPGFHEGTAWNYTFYVPHDIDGLATLMGGPKAFCDKLQKVFDNGWDDPANEPDIAYAYLFSRFKGYEHLTAKTIDKLLADNFSLKPDGIPGNDDTGTMSTWAVFSMMGIYPDCPGDPSYTLTTPTFDKVQIGDKLLITKTKGRRISSMKLGGKAYKSYRVGHAELLDAGKLEFKCR